MMKRVGDPQLAPDARRAAFTLRTTELAANKGVYFDVKVQGRADSWSTNFDVYAAPADGSTAPHNLTAENTAWDVFLLAAPDGKTLYYLAMKTSGFEADRFAIMAIDLTTGKTREVDPD